MYRIFISSSTALLIRSSLLRVWNIYRLYMDRKTVPIYGNIQVVCELSLFCSDISLGRTQNKWECERDIKMKHSHGQRGPKVIFWSRMERMVFSSYRSRPKIETRRSGEKKASYRYCTGQFYSISWFRAKKKKTKWYAVEIYFSGYSPYPRPQRTSNDTGHVIKWHVIKVCAADS